MARNGLALFQELEVWDVTAATKTYALGGQRVALRRDGILSYVHTDHLGSASVLTDASGQVVPNTRLRYYPFGAPRPDGASTTHNAFATGYSDATFTGQRRDVGTGLYFYGARYYDSAIGRFIQADTLVPQPGNPQSLNRYSYVGNRPLIFRDPTGHAQVCADGDEGGGCGYAATPDVILQADLDLETMDLYLWSYMAQHPNYNPALDSALTGDGERFIATNAKFQVSADPRFSDRFGASNSNLYASAGALALLALSIDLPGEKPGDMCLNCGTIKPDLARSTGKLRIDADGASVYCATCLKGGHTNAEPGDRYWIKPFDNYAQEALDTNLGAPEYTPQFGGPGHFSVFRGGPTDETTSLWIRLNEFIRTDALKYRYPGR